MKRSLSLLTLLALVGMLLSACSGQPQPKSLPDPTPTAADIFILQDRMPGLGSTTQSPVSINTLVAEFPWKIIIIYVNPQSGSFRFGRAIDTNSDSTGYINLLITVAEGEVGYVYYTTPNTEYESALTTAWEAAGWEKR